MTTKTFFVTGTDTEVGKTVITCGLLATAQLRGSSAIGLKPIAAGCETMDGKWVNNDALLLQQHNSVALPYEDINPIALQAAIAPHIAAERQSKKLSVDELADHCHSIIETKGCDYCFIEGAGGWLVPLSDKQTTADLVSALQIPTLLVVGVKLGCINHALLTVAAIQQSGVKLKGWVANCIDPQAQVVEDNIDYLRSHIEAPCLGVVPFLESAINGNTVAQHLNIDALSLRQNQI